MSVLAINEGTSGDLDRACDLWFLADEGPPRDVATRHVVTKQLADEMLELWQRPPAHLFLAEVSGRLVGTVFGKPLRDDALTGHVSMLAVHPEWQRRGVGSRLMDTVRAKLVDDGCIRCRLYVAESDHEVQRFYEKRGWTFTGEVEPSPDTAAPERIYFKAPLP
jgi:ribosomal protein S18 acetylase RimI-like enzyme